MALNLRCMVSWQVGSMLPRDVYQINPCFQVIGALEGIFDGDDFCDDLATAIKAWELAPTNHQLTVKTYDIEGEKPVRPNGTAIKQANTAQQTSYPPELALCLSFNGGVNDRHQRGRLYLPHVKISNQAPSNRPTQTEREKVLALAPILAGAGGPDISWGIWSKSRNVFTQAKNVYVDDEWDVQRRRGLKPTTRSSATTGG